MKRRMIGILCAMTLAASAFAGCGAEGGSTEKTENTAKEKSEGAKAEGEASDILEETQSTTYGTSKEGKFVVGFDQDFPPMGFVGEDGEYTGFDIELAAEVAERLELEFVPQPINWDAKDLELSAGTIDCIWNGFTMTGREDDYTFSSPYLNNKQVFVVNADSDIQSLQDLEGKIVDVQADSSALKALNENTELKDSFGMLQEVPDYNTAMMELEQGSVDAIAMDQVVAAYQIEGKEKSFRILDQEISSEEYAVGFLLGNEKLRDNVEDTLKEMAKDGTMEQISTKWFGSDITTFKAE